MHGKQQLMESSMAPPKPETGLSMSPLELSAQLEMATSGAVILSLGPMREPPIGVQELSVAEEPLPSEA